MEHCSRYLKLFLLLLLASFVSCSNGNEDSYLRQKEPKLEKRTDVIEAVFEKQLLCSRSVEAKLEQIRLLSEDVLKKCKRAQVPSKISCNNSCAMSYDITRGVYTNISISARKVFSENGQSQNQFKIDFVPPTKILGDVVRCINPENTNYVKFAYNTLFNVACKENKEIEKPVALTTVKDLERLRVNTSAERLGKPLDVSQASIENSCALNLVEKLFKKFEEGLDAMDQSFCPSGTFQNVRVNALNNYNTRATLLSIAKNDGEKFRFTLWANGLKSLLDALNGRSAFRVSRFSACYPLRIHPARARLSGWILQNWEGLIEDAGCSKTPPPFSLQVLDRSY